MRTLIFWIALLVAVSTPPSLAFAQISVSEGVRTQCAATSFDGATCARLARIAGELVESETVSEALAGEVASLAVEQGEWLAQALDAQARAAELQPQEANVAGDGREWSQTPDDSVAATSAEPPPPPQARPQQSVLRRALEKARDYIRRAIGGR